ncbi:MAG TPA: ATP-binding protein [Parafilimonas sp.]|nr:ATP-binding protein [Parafilimonas sp.]
MELLNVQFDNITLLVSIAIAVMLLLIISFLLAFNTSQRKKFQYQQNLLKLKEEQQNELIKAAVRSEETERHRISEELHDEVGALLSATKLYLSNLHDKYGHEDREIYKKSLDLLDESIHKVRSISHNLHSGILKELGLNQALQSFAQKLNQPDRLQVITNLDEHYSSKDPENDITMYRIIQEICGNIIKHSHATQLKITSHIENSVLTHIENSVLTFSIQHNGEGLTQDEFERLRYETKGLGLKNIQNRIILLKGKINFERHENENTITLVIPVNTLL